jgi:hypothetical protein
VKIPEQLLADNHGFARKLKMNNDYGNTIGKDPG